MSTVVASKGGRIKLITTFIAKSSREMYVFSILFILLNRELIFLQWRGYNPWDLTGRLDADMNMYDGPGGCSVFRTFQGWLGLSRHGPGEGVLIQSSRTYIHLMKLGTLVVHPILQPSTAYWMLRPFFKPTQKGSLNGWKFSLDDENGDIFLHGANPGTAQEHNPDIHPHLLLQETMIPYPIVEPGDTGKLLITPWRNCIHLAANST
jgi:hypothetical protein